MMIDLARRQPCAREIRPVRGIWPFLRLQAERVRLAIEPSLSATAAVEMIAGIELQPRLVRHEFQPPPRARRHYPRGKPHTLAVPQAVIVIVTEAVAKLPLIATDAGTDRGGVAEIERSPGYRTRRPGQRNRGVVDGEKGV